MTKRADIPSSEIEYLLRLLAHVSDQAGPAQVESCRTQMPLSLMTAVDWSARMMPLSLAALMGVAMTLFLISSGDTLARAHAEINAPNRPAKANRLLHKFNTLFPDSVQTVTPAAALDATTNSRFAFIRGGVDNVMLTWTLPRREAKEAQPKKLPRKFRRSHKRASAQQVRAATSTPQRHPWLLDLLTRHMARGS